MRTTRNLLLPLLPLTLLAAGSVTGATRNWDGGSADSNWTTPQNWENNVAPAAGDDLVFSTGEGSPSNNEFANGISQQYRLSPRRLGRRLIVQAASAAIAALSH